MIIHYLEDLALGLFFTILHQKDEGRMRAVTVGERPTACRLRDDLLNQTPKKPHRQQDFYPITLDVRSLLIVLSLF